MSEVFRVRCPSCDKPLKVPAAARGRNVECSGCGTDFKISSKLTAKKKAAKPQAARPTARPSPQRPRPQLPGAPKKPTRSSPDFYEDELLDIDDDIEVIDDVEILDDVDVIDDVEVLDEPRRKPTRKSKKISAKPGRRSRSDVVEDFEVVEDFIEDYDDDFLDLPDGYEDGPAVPKPPKKKKKRKRESAPRRQRDDHEEEGGIGSVIGGLVCMIAGAAFVYFGLTTETRRPIRAIGFGAVLFFSGAGTVIKSVLD